MKGTSIMSTPVFKGVATALITPFTDEGIDYASFCRLIEEQLTNGIDALVVCGTTGEASTMSDEERKSVVEFVIKQVHGRVPVIAGCGSNNTSHACELAAHAGAVGADALLAVTPYYNKCTQDGIYEHYKAIAESSDKPLIVYNVPSRTGVNIEPATYLRLSSLPLFGGIKEAGGSVSAAAKTLSLCPEGTHLYSGSDELFLPMLSVGADGIISVASNVAPRRMKEIWSCFRSGKNALAAKKNGGDDAARRISVFKAEPDPRQVSSLLRGQVRKYPPTSSHTHVKKESGCRCSEAAARKLTISFFCRNDSSVIFVVRDIPGL